MEIHVIRPERMRKCNGVAESKVFSGQSKSSAKHNKVITLRGNKIRYIPTFSSISLSPCIPCLYQECRAVSQKAYQQGK